MSRLEQTLEALLNGRREKNRFRSLKEYDTSPTGLVDFSSNDYLSITTSHAVRKNFIDRITTSPQILGSTGSRLLSGSTTSHTALEARFATFFNSPSALLFNSGWDANVSFFSTIPQPGDWVVFDELVHASVHSGMRASRVPGTRRIAFRHNDPESLGEVLQRIRDEPGGSGSVVFLAMESLYSMDGDMAPLPAILDVFDEFIPRERQCVVLDEAHSTGVYGKGGRGVAHALGEEGGGDMHALRGKGRISVRLMTFGKAVGCSGAVLLSSTTIRSFLINFARPLIFSTALPHSTLHALESVWDVLVSAEGDRRRKDLMEIATYLQKLLQPLLESTSPGTLRLPKAYPAPFAPGREHLPANPPSPILGLITPEPHRLAKYFLNRGFIVRPVVPPTVPPGEERVRICLRADMGKEMIERLVGVLRDWVGMKRDEEGRGRRGGSGGLEGQVLLKAKL